MTHTDLQSTVDFLAYHIPGLESGSYSVTVKQEVQATSVDLPGILLKVAESLDTQHFEETWRFTVAGERFTLKPADIFAVFPPEDSLGDHSTVLPHVVLNRSTLPWELAASREDHADESAHIPWLALLLFHEDESLGGTITRQEFLDAYKAEEAGAVWERLLTSGWLRPLAADQALIVAREGRTARALGDDLAAATGLIEAALDRYRSPRAVRLGDLKTAAQGPLHWPELRYDSQQNTDDDLVTVIDVEKSLLAAMIPTAKELQLLTHVRRGGASNGNGAADELAVVIGNRLPGRNSLSSAHLVSVEGRYSGGQFAFDGAGDGEYIRLISLKSWRFACVDPAGDFGGLIKGLDRTPGTLRLPIQDGPLEPHVARGHVPAPYAPREREPASAWYRGPLITCANTTMPTLPAESAAALVTTDALGMADVSYAAAWELGRLLTLQSRQISVALYNWKRSNAQSQKAEQLRTMEAALLHPSWTGAPEGEALPKQLAGWFDDLRVLRGVPLSYLVPDERMLPPESIRFFQVDHAWVDCLLDGAFSIGRVTGRLKETDRQQKTVLDEHTGPATVMSGFLIRSSLVAGWPGLLADARDKDENGLDLLRFDRLAPSVLLCLFRGLLVSADLHQRPEALHFGFHLDGNGHDNLIKKWRGPDGNELDNSSVAVPMRKNERHVVDVSELRSLMETASKVSFTPSLASAEFAFQMMEGVQKVQFNQAS